MLITHPLLFFLPSLLLLHNNTTDVNKSLLNLHKVGEENNDPQLCDFIESEYLEEQVEAIKKIADLVTQLNRVGGDGLGCKLSFLPLFLPFSSDHPHPRHSRISSAFMA